jgi:hypothetical protein
MVPLFITAIRSHIPRSSGISDEIIRDRDTLLGEFHHQFVDLGLRSDVDALGRLIKDQYRRLRDQPPAECDLLLIAAG